MTRVQSSLETVTKKTVLVLTIDAIPPNNWGENLHKYLSPEVWDALRREVYAHFDWTCAACGATEVEVHCHEEWKFDDKRYRQKLLGFLCLCQDCHSIKHWGRTSRLHKEGRLSTKEIERLKRHFCLVNGVTSSFFDSYLNLVAKQIRIRNSNEYKLSWGKFSPRRITEIWINLKKGKDQKKGPFLV